jgi:hypothetical protein
MLAGDYTLCGHRSQHQFLGETIVSCQFTATFFQLTTENSKLTTEKCSNTNGERTLGPLPIWLLDSAGNPA